ncbi:hypothetical protein SmJEL517_g05752 [Synchytrium microbalum]|uniref:Uncharacterized protein n=1 Tax=Synchytrium microbalum TaxID=1806994 RepID=A0A507BYH0_9FUNG|nr:uncharacterized protein SmJEL517_g05752 [Synchytrium microbalum]TPX30766.1 hypothetical protein SmJEL517_g05752 [Synchytrium microbalum]
MEALKSLYDLHQLHKTNPTPFLSHLFKTFDPTTSKPLTSSIKHYGGGLHGNPANGHQHSKARGSGHVDYRSALDQLHDWIWGWEINADGGDQQRTARAIRITETGQERIEAEKIVMTFLTLLTLSRRSLRALYLDIERALPKIGAPADFDDLFGKTDEAYDAAESERIWAQNGDGTSLQQANSEERSADDSTDSLDVVHQATLLLQREKGVTVRAVKEDEELGPETTADDMVLEEDEEAEEDGEYVPPSGMVGFSRTGSMLASQGSHRASRQSSSFMVANSQRPSAAGGSTRASMMSNNNARNSAVPNNNRASFQRASTRNARLPSIPSGDASSNQRTSAAAHQQSQSDVFKEIRRQSLGNLDHRKSSDRNTIQENHMTAIPATSETSLQSGASTPAELKAEINFLTGEPVVSTNSSLFGHLHFSGTSKTRLDENTATSRRHVDRLLSELDRAVDMTLTCASAVVVILGLSEAVNDIETFSRHVVSAHEIANEFVATLLKALLDLLIREFPPGIVDSDDVKDLSQLEYRLKALYDARMDEYEVLQEQEQEDAANIEAEGTAIPTTAPKKAKARPPQERKFDRKFALLHNLLSAVDVHLFPCAVRAHTEGCKSAQCSRLGPNLWLTSGYDGMVKIHDLEAGKELSQYAGHSTIVTSARFAKDESTIVSCSFDKTIRIWNSSTAGCDRVLLGHTDALTCADVSLDSRYILTASTDMTVKLWDLNSGECLATVRRHTRWVKVVRFSPDGKYFVSGGLDKRMHVWDTKAVIHNKDKGIQPVRTIEAHSEPILDIALSRPSLLLSCAKDGTLRLHDYITGQQILNISLMPSWCSSLAFAPGGEYFAAGSQDATVTVFKTHTGEQVRKLRVLNGGVLCVAFAKDLNFLAVGTVEGLLQLLPL